MCMGRGGRLEEARPARSATHGQESNGETRVTGKGGT